MLKRRVFEQALQQAHHALVVDGEANGTKCRGALFPEAVFGRETYTDLIFGEMPGKKSQQMPNLIGLRFLARHLVTLNFPKRMMYLKRVSAGPLADEGSRKDAPGTKP